MKKRLLITSIVMMLVVAVALSTATYAWFTSNQSVSATSITMTASTSDSAALAIAWVPSSGDPTFGNYITTGAIDSETSFGPVAPTTITQDTAFASMTFASATIKTLDNRNYFNATPEASAPNANSNVYVWNDGESTASTEIRLKNMSQANATGTITITATIADNDNNGETANGIDLIRVAVFKKDNDTYKLVGIMANGANNKIAYGTIAAPAVPATPTEYETAEVKMHISGNSAQDTPVVSTNAVDCSVGLTLGTLSTLATMDLKVIVWMDGQALGDTEGGLAATIGLNITAA